MGLEGGADAADQQRVRAKRRVAHLRGLPHEPDDDRSVDVFEFCYVLHLIDDEDDDVDVGTASAETFRLEEATEEMAIAKLCFDFYAYTPETPPAEVGFRKQTSKRLKRIEEKLDALAGTPPPTPRSRRASARKAEDDRLRDRAETKDGGADVALGRAAETKHGAPGDLVVTPL